MPPARSATSAPRRDRSSRSSARPRKVTNRLPISKVAWDRKFRTIMLAVLLLVGWIGVRAASSLVSTRAQSAAELRLVSSLAAANRRLEAEQRALGQPATIARDARALGMVKANERAYVVTGLPSH